MSSTRAEVPTKNPIANGLSPFCDEFAAFCTTARIERPFDSAKLETDQDFKNKLVDLVITLQNLPAAAALASVTGRGTLRNDLRRFIPVVDSDDFDITRLFPLINVVLDRSSDEVVWDRAYAAVVEPTPPPTTVVDAVLKEELGSIYIGVHEFDDVYFGSVEKLEEASAAIFRRCQEGQASAFVKGDGWRNWPPSTSEKDVLEWLCQIIDILRSLAVEEGLSIHPSRTILAQPSRPLEGSVAGRKLDIGIASDSSSPHWSQVLVLGELKSNPKADTASQTWRDLARYAREVLTSQDTRRFSLGFTLCGSIMRLWEFDRLGAIASSPFDINRDGLRFVRTIIAFLLMDEVLLGFDPTISTTTNGKHYIEIVQDGIKKRIILDRLMKRSPCVAGRATTCWKAYCENQPDEILVVKDSWQYPEREEEGDFLREATAQNVTNVARYFYHETVKVKGEDDDICNNVRGGLGLSQATNMNPTGKVKGGRSAGNTSRKRSSSTLDAALPPSKRTCSGSVIESGQNNDLQNRVHRRVIVRDYGVPIYKAPSRSSFLHALESCLEGYNSLHAKAGLLQGDISTGNLILSAEVGNAKWAAFLIDLDLAIKVRRDKPSGARAKTGTRAFMAIGLLLGEQHSYRHDLESFFWVLFWVCVHYNGPNEPARVVERFDRWNFADPEELADIKTGLVGNEGHFLNRMEHYFTPFYQPLAQWVNRLRRQIFPMDKSPEAEDPGLWLRMKRVLIDAQKDPSVMD